MNRTLWSCSSCARVVFAYGRFALALVCACSSSSSPAVDGGAAGAMDGGSDGGGDDASSDAAGCANEPCCVMTCSGPVSLMPGQTVSKGDTCAGDTCSFQGSGGLGTCGCTSTEGCPCPDAGP
jgi:hypothetical protein